MKSIIEGSTKLLVHTGLPTKSMPVFFNPVKSFDRDLSVKILSHLKPLHCLDLLSGGGARGIRLMNEAGITDMTFNDSNPEAVKLLKRNLKLNKLKARVCNKEANSLLYKLDEYFDYIDIDPFGSPNPYLESSMRFLQRRGVLAVTATDTAVLVGARPKACVLKYHSRVIRHPFMKETGLRALIKHVIERGAECDYALTPVIAHSTAHYYRAYFIKDLGAKRALDLVNLIRNIHYCPKCAHRGLEPCAHKECITLGPLYTGSINSLEVSPYRDEDKFPPWHFTTTELVRLTKLSGEPKMSELINKVNGVRSHYEPKAFKTELSIKEILKLIS